MAAAALWGSADFGAGISSRRRSALEVVLVAQLIGASAALGMALVFAERVPGPASVGWAGLAGTCGALGLAALYTALAAGRMSVVAPISGVLAAAIPVLLGVASAGAPGAGRFAGFGIGLIAVVLVSLVDAGPAEPGAPGRRPSDDSGSPAAAGSRISGRLSLGLALAAGVALGGYNSAIAQVDAGSTFASLAASRMTAVLVVAAIIGVSRTPLHPTKAALPLLALVGCLDMAGNAAYVIAAQLGRLDVAAVLSSLYPVATVALAAAVLRERVTRLQLAGIVLAVLAIALIAGG